VLSDEVSAFLQSQELGEGGEREKRKGEEQQLNV